MTHIFDEDLEIDAKYYAVDHVMDHLDPSNQCNEDCESCSYITGPYNLEEAAVMYFTEPSVNCHWNIFRYETKDDIVYRHYYWPCNTDSDGIIEDYCPDLSTYTPTKKDDSDNEIFL